MHRVRELARVVPDLGRLFLRLSRDRRVPLLRRLQLIVLGAYLVSPIDLIPDFIPGIGQLDDAALAALALRGVVRSAGPKPRCSRAERPACSTSAAGGCWSS